MRAAHLALLFLVVLPPGPPRTAAEPAPVSSASATTTAVAMRCEELREIELALAKQEFALLQNLDSPRAQAWQREAWATELLSLRESLDENDTALTENHCPSL